MARASSWMKLHRLGAARRDFALRRMADVLESELPALAAEARRIAAIQREVHWMQLTAQSAKEARRMHGRDARKLDARLDRALGGLYRGLEAFSRALPADDPGAIARDRMRERLFPSGVSAISRLPYVDQHYRVDVMLQVVRDPDGQWSEEARNLGIEPLLRNIAEINEAYGRLLTAPKPPSRAQIRAAEDAAFEEYAELVLRVLASAPEEERGEWRARVTKPIVDQQDEAAQYRRRKSWARADAD